MTHSADHLETIAHAAHERRRTWPHDCDVAIIGAGVAGASAALHLLSFAPNLRVLLLERSRWPRDKVCGCCINAAGVRELAAMGLWDELRLLSQSLHTLELHCGRKTLSLPQHGGIAISRGELDAAIVARAQRAGAEFQSGVAARVLGTAPDGRYRVQISDGREHQLLARLVIAADGLSGSSLAELPEFAVRIARKSLMGLGCILPEPSSPIPEPGTIHMSVGPGGYVGSVRLHDGRIDIAAALDPALIKHAGGPASALQALWAHCYVPPIVLGDVRPQGCGLLTRSRNIVALPGLLVVGDAAGYVEPFTGEGMTWAMAGARQVALIAAEALAAPAAQHHRAMLRAAQAWTNAHRQQIAGRQTVCRALRTILRSPALVQSAITIAHTVPIARRTLTSIATRLTRPYTTAHPHRNRCLSVERAP